MVDESKPKFIVFKYKDATITQVHLEALDGKWEHENNTYIIEYDYNFYQEKEYE